MNLLLTGLVALAAFALGLASLSFLMYRNLLKRSLQGRPAYITMPGNRPGLAKTYAITSSGWRRLTPKGPSKRARRKARRRLKQAMKAAKAPSPAQALRARMETPEPVSEEQTT